MRKSGYKAMATPLTHQSLLTTHCLFSASSAPLRWKRIGGARMLAVVTLRPGIQGRNYRLPTDHDYKAVWKAQKRLKAILDEWERGGKKGLCPVPDEPIAMNEIRRVSVLLYGATTWGDIFTKRQMQSLYTYARIIQDIDTTESSSRLCSRFIFP